MFPRSHFGSSYFARSYFPPLGVIVIAWQKIIRFTLQLNQTVGFKLTRWYDCKFDQIL